MGRATVVSENTVRGHTWSWGHLTTPTPAENNLNTLRGECEVFSGGEEYCQRNVGSVSPMLTAPLELWAQSRSRLGLSWWLAEISHCSH